MTVARTTAGSVQGTKADGVEIFLGVPYAAPPIGPLRFCATQTVRPWEGEYDATRYRNRAPQDDPYCPELLGPTGPGPTSEDCLYLNIFTPSADRNRRPVLVWIHGGGLIAGSANEFDGRNLAKQGDVVVVCLNYRLGLLGFLDLSHFGARFAGSASNGYRDQISALAWVRDNIAAFGGNPDNVTIVGQSAGGGSVRAILASPSADGLYHKAISMSPGSPTAAPVDYAGYLKSALGVEENQLIDRLYSLSSNQLLELQNKSGFVGSGSIDGVVVTRPTAQAIRERGSRNVPVISGTARDEGTMMNAVLESMVEPGGLSPDAPMLMNIAAMIMRGGSGQHYISRLKSAHPKSTPEKLSELIWTDLMRQQAIELVEATSAAGASAWLYRFDFPSPIRGGALGATHIVDVPFVFNDFKRSVLNISRQDPDDKTVQRIASQWSDAFLRFAREGNPNGPGIPFWPTYSAPDRRCLIVDTDTHVESDPDKIHRALWQDKLEQAGRAS